MVVIKRRIQINNKEINNKITANQLIFLEINRNITDSIIIEQDVIKKRNHVAENKSSTRVKIFILTDIKVKSVKKIARISVVLSSRSFISL